MLTKVFSYVAKPNDGLPGTQIDLLIDRMDGTTHICEIKFSKGAYILDKKTSENIRQKHAVFQYNSKSKEHFFTTLIAIFGLVDNKCTMDDLLG